MKLKTIIFLSAIVHSHIFPGALGLEQIKLEICIMCAYTSVLQCITVRPRAGVGIRCHASNKTAVIESSHIIMS